MNPTKRIAITATGLFVALILVAFVLMRPAGSDEIARGVTVGGIDVGGLDRASATEAIVAHEDALASLPVTALLDGGEKSVSPDQLGFSLAVEDGIDAALQVGREGPIFNRFASWMRSIFGGHRVDLPASLDNESLEAVLTGWESEGVEGRASTAGIAVVDGVLVATYSAPTPIIVRDGAYDRMLEVVLDFDRPILALESVLANTGVPDDKVDEALIEAEQLIGGPVTLIVFEPPATLTLERAELAAAFTTVVAGDMISVTLEPTVLEPRFAELREAFSATFRNAELTVDADDNVTITPGQSGLRVDSERIVEAIIDASKTNNRSGPLPVIDDAQPDVTEADLADLKIEHVVSAFTTYHDCCQNRVVNIHLMADTINGTIVLPGETFSVNDTVGERTSAKGYLPAGTIVDGELVDTVGGGVSQFATTMYNAVFWGGYTDVTHKPHSIYFSRYPEGIEATLDFPSIDLAFRNDTDGAVYIKAVYTDTSLTIKLLGSNGGRSLAGEQRSGSTTISVVESGDPGVAVEVAGSVSGRYGATSPATVYQPDSTQQPGTSRTIQSGRDGWSVTITRTKTFPDGTVDTQEWVARYRSQPLIIEVHPCEIPSGRDGYTGQPCPTTTTSTVPSTSTIGATTTTTEATTTTTAGG